MTKTIPTCVNTSSLPHYLATFGCDMEIIIGRFMLK